MSTRLKVRLVIACIGVVVLLVIRMVHPTRVTFSPANMSIDPGKGWKAVALPPAAASVCSPSLIGPGGMINALLLDEDLTEVNAAAEKLKANLVAAGKAPADAIKQEDFTTASGLAGVHFSYTGKSAKSDTTVKSHHFITRNMHSRCVDISYITSPEQESSDTIAGIIKTLRVE
jgi:hypothetical protein